MSEDDPTVILCPRIEDMPVAPIPGATRDSCLACSAPIWVAPSTRTIYADGLDKGEDWRGLHCIQCGMEMAELTDDQQDEVMKIIIHEAQLAEITATLAVREVPEESEDKNHDQHDPDNVVATAAKTAATVPEQDRDQQDDEEESQQVHG